VEASKHRDLGRQVVVRLGKSLVASKDAVSVDLASGRQRLCCCEPDIDQSYSQLVVNEKGRSRDELAGRAPMGC
jgi:hypothetical protein